MQGHYLLGSYAMEECADPHPAPQTAWRVMIGLVASDEGRFWLKKKVGDFFKQWEKLERYLRYLKQICFFFGGGKLEFGM